MRRLRALSLMICVGCLASLVAEPAAAASTFTVNSTADAPDAVRDGVCATASGRCTLRAAIQEANSRFSFFDPDLIQFAIPTKPFSSVPTISPGSELPAITSPVVVDGTTQRARWVNLDGSSSGGIGLYFNKTTGCVVKGMVIGNFSRGVWAYEGGSHRIEGNRLGIDPSGNQARTNHYGISLIRSPNNVVRGNVVSGGALFSIYIVGDGATNNIVAGNIIGLKADGTAGAGMGNIDGVVVNTGGNRIGGVTAADRNVISGNELFGISLDGDGSVVQGNYVGTDASGTTLVPNSAYGIQDRGENSVIGGTAGTSTNACTGACNLIAGSPFGVFLDSGANARVEGNFIGTNVTGDAALPNGMGIRITNASASRIGGTVAAARNLISGNTGNGVVIERDGQNHRILGNTIGLASDDVTPLGNGSNGVFVRAMDNDIGGGADGAGNRIAFNAGDGVFVFSRVDASTGNSVRENVIYGNAGLGIDLWPDGVNANDIDDDDGGANEGQNFPVLTSVTSAGGMVTVRGTLNSLPDTTFRLEVFRQAACDPSGNGEGRLFVGGANITTDANGDASFTKTFDGGIPAGVAVTATVTGNRNTSEFSACRTAV